MTNSDVHFDVTLELVKTSDTVRQARLRRIRPNLGLAFISMKGLAIPTPSPMQALF
jgi:hypothetical protein